MSFLNIAVNRENEHPLTFMSSSVTYPTCSCHQGRMAKESTGLCGRRSRQLFLKKANFLVDLDWFMRSMYWFRPMPNSLKPGKVRD